MPRRVKPRWGWEPTHDSKDASRREALLDWDWLYEQFGAVDEAACHKVWREISVALLPFYDKQFGVADVRIDEVEASLKDVAKSAKELSEKLQKLDWKSRTWLRGIWEDASKPGSKSEIPNAFPGVERYFDRNFSDTHQAMIVAILETAHDAITNYDFPREQISKGRKPQSHVKDLITGIASTLKTSTGIDPLQGFHYDAINERYLGKLVDILEHIFGRYSPELRLSNAAIGDQIRRTIGDRSKH